MLKKREKTRAIVKAPMPMFKGMMITSKLIEDKKDNKAKKTHSGITPPPILFCPGEKDRPP